MTKIIFAGPSISDKTRNLFLSYDSGNIILPPVKAGTLWSCLSEYNDITDVLIIDGYFYTDLAILHREILDLIRQNITVIGCSSLGALRAVELNKYGMIGLGYIYNFYQLNMITGDDEVAIMHSNDKEYIQYTIPLINLRLMIENIEDIRVNKAILNTLINKLSRVSFTKRNWNYIQFILENICHDEAEEQIQVIKENYIDYKKLDSDYGVKYLMNESKMFLPIINNRIKKYQSRELGIKSSLTTIDKALIINETNSLDRLSHQSFISALRLNSFFSEEDMSLALYKKLIINEYGQSITVTDHEVKQLESKLFTNLKCSSHSELKSKLGMSITEIRRHLREDIIFRKYIKYKTDELSPAIQNDLLFNQYFISLIKDNLSPNHTFTIMGYESLKKYCETAIEFRNKLSPGTGLHFLLNKLGIKKFDLWRKFLNTRMNDIYYLIDKIIN